jgi:hypothetical protein
MRFLITIEDGQSVWSGHEAASSPRAARASAIRSAVQIIADEIIADRDPQALKCIVQDAEGKTISAVTVKLQVGNMTG